MFYDRFSQTQGQSYRNILNFQGILFVLNFGFTLVGILANCLGLYFFIKKQRKDLTTRMFIALCSIDLATCLTVGPFQILVNVRAINYYDFSTQNFVLFSIMSAIAGIEVRLLNRYYVYYLG